VYVRGYNLRPSVAKEVRKSIYKYQTGVKNKSTNIYENNNTDNSIPQVKFIHLENQITPDMKEKIIEYINGKAVENSDSNIPLSEMPDDYAPYLINKVFSEENSLFWKTLEENRQKASNIEESAVKEPDKNPIASVDEKNYVCLFNEYWRVVHNAKLCYNSWDTKERALKYLKMIQNGEKLPNYFKSTMRFLTPAS
jgi:hypothetical protein